jgi:lysophospholipid acyltransferase
MAFFASPARDHLKKMLEERQARVGVKLARTISQDSVTGQEPVLGMSADPAKDLDEVVEELRAEVQAMRKSKAS